MVGISVGRERWELSGGKGAVELSWGKGAVGVELEGGSGGNRGRRAPIVSVAWEIIRVLSTPIYNAIGSKN